MFSMWFVVCTSVGCMYWLSCWFSLVIPTVSFVVWHYVVSPLLVFHTVVPSSSVILKNFVITLFLLCLLRGIVVSYLPLCVLFSLNLLSTMSSLLMLELTWLSKLSRHTSFTYCTTWCWFPSSSVTSIVVTIFYKITRNSFFNKQL
jgi:hypothetical protein